MIRKYKILVLTDHRGHSKENSVYAIGKALAVHPSCEMACIASRGLEENNDFFISQRLDKLWCSKIDSSFDFYSDGRMFRQAISCMDTTRFDIIMLRLPRPISNEFLLALGAHWSKKVIVNSPNGIIETSSKAFLLNFTEFCPPMKLCRSREEILEFASQYELVLKPLRDYGGRGIVRLTNSRVLTSDKELTLNEYFESIHQILQTEGLLAMKFLENVSKGDKRIIVVDGQIMGATLRLPADNSWLCNIAKGGRSVQAQADEEEILMISALDKLLSENGVMIYGVDTLVGDDGKRLLSEINTLSIGGFPQAEKQTGIPIISRTIDKIIAKAEAHYG